MRRDYSSPAARALRRPCRAPRLLVSDRTRSTSTSSCTASTRLHSPGCSDLPRLRRASGCLCSSRGSSRGSSRHSSSTFPPHPCSLSTTSPPLRGQVHRHVAWLVAWLVTPLVVDYFAYAAHPGASARRAACHGVRRRLLRAPQLLLADTLALLLPRCASRLLVSWQHWLYFEYAARRLDVVFQSHRVDHSSRLVFQTSRERQSRPQQLVGINSD
jgi:hypothetical protein